MKFGLVFWRQQSQNSPNAIDRTNSNPFATYHNRDLKTKP